MRKKRLSPEEEKAERLDLTLLELSHLEHFERCKRNGNVPIILWDGSWCHSHNPIELMSLFLRLPKKLRRLTATPAGLRLNENI